MKNLEHKAIEQLLTIIPDHPANAIMQFSDGGEALPSAIKTLCKERGYDFQFNILDADFYEKVATNYTEKDVCITKLVKWEQRRYASMARLYYTIFVTATVPDDKREAFIDNVLHHIKTAGHIVLLLPKNDHHILDTWWRLLEEKSFVSMSTIDISEKYEVLAAKKMHGWDSYH